MPSPERSLLALQKVLANEPDVNVLLASEPAGEVVIQRLNLREDLTTEFLTVARDAFSGDESQLALKPYDPGYKPEPKEITYVELAQNAAIAEQIHSFSQVQQAELFSEDDKIVDNLRFYAIVVSASAKRHAVFLRSYSPSKELTRRRGFAAIFRAGQYDKLETKVFLFDRNIDCFAWDGYLFINNVPAFQRIFKYFDEVRAKANETVDAILALVPIGNAEGFREACTGQIQMMAKLSQISRKPYLSTVTMKDIRRTIVDFNLDLQIAKMNGKEQLVFEGTPSKRWLILKLLDDNFLGSIMTHQKYEVNSKSAIQTSKMAAPAP
jgi:hypothetical protein